MEENISRAHKAPISSPQEADQLICGDSLRMTSLEWQYVSMSHATTIHCSYFLKQPQCNRLVMFLTWITMLRMNRA